MGGRESSADPPLRRRRRCARLRARRSGERGARREDSPSATGTTPTLGCCRSRIRRWPNLSARQSESSAKSPSRLSHAKSSSTPFPMGRLVLQMFIDGDDWHCRHRHCFTLFSSRLDIHASFCQPRSSLHCLAHACHNIRSTATSLHSCTKMCVLPLRAALSSMRFVTSGAQAINDPMAHLTLR